MKLLLPGEGCLSKKSIPLPWNVRIILAFILWEKFWIWMQKPVDLTCRLPGQQPILQESVFDYIMKNRVNMKEKNYGIQCGN